MARDWPAKDVGPLVALIADPRHAIAADGTIRLSEEQAKAILDLRLQRLTALGRDEIGDEVKKLGVAIQDYLDILRSRARVLAIARKELEDVKAEFATPRLTELVEAEIEVEDEDLIEREDVAVTVTHAGYIKRTPLAEYRVQGRGGKGRSGMATREEDFVTHIFVASTHAPLVFFSSTGMAYKLKVWRLPEAHIQGRGKAMVNLLPLAGGRAHHDDPAAARKRSGVGKAVRRLRHEVRRRAAQRAFRFRQHQPQRQDRDEAGGAGRHRRRRRPAPNSDDFLLTTRLGKCIRFPIGDVRVFKGREFDRRARHQACRRR